jgi:CheY-like chemotaxis protein
VLVVEDDPALLRMYARGLEAVGYVVQGACDGAEALRLVTTAPFDTVVSDLRMPRMSGLDLALEVRRRIPELPILLMTAQLDPQAYAQARAAGVVRYLLKPVGLEQLARAVSTAVKLKASLVRIRQRRERSA